MMEAARSLLSAVTKLLLLADHVDLSQILHSVAETERRLGQLRGCRASPGAVREVERAVVEVLGRTGRRQQDLLDPADWERLAEARERLRSSSAALLRSQSDQAVGQVSQALQCIQSVLQSVLPESHQGGEKHHHSRAGDCPGGGGGAEGEEGSPSVPPGADDLRSRGRGRGQGDGVQRHVH